MRSTAGGPGVGLACALFTVLSLVWTLPLPLRLVSALPNGSGDLWQNYWNLWWWRHALAEGQSPYHTSLLFHPQGASLALHTHSPFNMIATLPVSIVLGVAAAYNVALIGGLVLSAIGAWLLAREVTGDGGSALLAGVVFAFFPHRLEQMTEHLNLASIQFLPFLLWSHLRWLARPRRGRLALVVLCFLLNALACLHYGLFALLLLPLFSAARWVRAREPHVPRATARALVLSCLALVPFVWPQLRAILAGETYVKPPEQKGHDLLFLLLPSDRHPVLGPLVDPVYRALRTYSSAGFTCFAGWTALGLACLGVRRGAARSAAVAPFAVLAIVFLALSFGARPHFAGEPVPWLRGPHAVFAFVPVLETLRVANRFHVVFMLALSVLAAVGLCSLVREVPRARRLGLVVLVLLLALFEYLWLPFPVRSLEEAPYHRFAEELRDDPLAGAVVDIPFATWAQTGDNMLLQTVHERPIADGYVSVPPEVVLARMDPALRSLHGMDPSLEGGIDVARLGELGFGTVIVHWDRCEERMRAGEARHAGDDHFVRKSWKKKGVPREKLEAVSRALREAAGPPVFHDERIEVFRLEVVSKED